MPTTTIFNSRDEVFKKPFGAIKANESLQLSLHIPIHLNCSTPVLFIQPDGGEAAAQPMVGNGSKDGLDYFKVELCLEEPGLYFYWFDLWVDYQKIFKGPHGKGVLSRDKGEKFPLTVYKADFETPSELHGGVMYQIFPDRFLEGAPDIPLAYNERIYREDKHNEPYFWNTENGQGGLTQDYFGGDLAGIQMRLPFLASLGATILYLNPIFEAHSNHRYNTADFFKVDPYLGTNEDFSRLCEKAREFGIRIILDGVFSHVGSDSIYFNKEGRYSSVGAWQGPQSPYRDWFHFKPDGSYESWWGFKTLPACNKQNPGFRKFITGDGGVIDFWLNLGAAGFRLDVADELPDDFIEEIRHAVKRNGSDKLLIGEVWEDAALKEAYSVRRRYFLGDELDGTMNYPFRDAILGYLKDFDADSFRESVDTICENYPPPALAACTTHLSTHDTARAITLLAGEDSTGRDRDWQSGRHLSPEQYHLGIQQLRLGFVLQFTLPGIPCVYYGDEIAMQGYADPFNRAYYNWHSSESQLIPLMINLSNLRKSCPAFKGSKLKFIQAENGILVYERAAGGERAVVAVNCSGWPAVVELLGETVTLPMMDFAIRATNYKFPHLPQVD